MYNNLGKFTEKEILILAELLKGKNNKEISDKFSITEHTVKAHIQKLLQKTNSNSRAQLISKTFTKLIYVDINSPDIYDTIQFIYDD